MSMFFRGPGLFLAIILAVFVGSFPTQAVATHAEDGDPTIQIATDSWDVNYPYSDLSYFAEELGYFDKYVEGTIGGLDSGFTEWEGLAVANGDAEFALHLYSLKAMPQELVAVAALTHMAPYHLAIAPGVDISSIPEMGGHAFVAYGCGLEGVGLASRQFIAMLQEAAPEMEYKCREEVGGERDPNTVYVIPTGSQASHKQADWILEQKDGIVGGLVSTKFALEVKKAGGSIIKYPEDFNAGDRKVPMSHLVTSRSFNEEHRDIVEQVVTALRETIKYMRQHPEEIKKIMREKFYTDIPNFTEEDAQFFYDTIMTIVPPDLCMDPKEAERAIRYYAFDDNNEMNLEGTIDYAGCAH